MTALYNERTTALAVNAGNTAASDNLNVGWDFTEHDASHTNGTAWKEPSTATLSKTGTINTTTRYGEVGRLMASINTWYTRSNVTDFGIQTGTGDFTFSIRIGMPTALPTNSTGVGTLLYVTGTSGIAISLGLNTNNGIGWYLSLSGGATINANGNWLIPGKRYVITLVRSGNTIYLYNTDVETGVTREQGSASFTMTMDTTRARDIYLAWSSSATSADTVFYACNHWTVALSEAVIEENVGINYWNTWDNTSDPDSITITAPTTSATIASSCIVSGSYTGTPPTGIAIQHNAGSWLDLTGVTISGGTWSGYANGITPATGTLKARYSNATTVESAGVTGIVVTSDAIAITAPVAWKSYQMDGSEQASVTITGTYAGSPTAIEYRYCGRSWLTLDASPSGNAFSESVTLDMGSGHIETRFSNSTGVIAVSEHHNVGDVWVIGGQSNGQGQATVMQTYTPSNGMRAARFTHPSPQGTAGAWNELEDPCDEYPGTPGGSWTQQLATLYLAAGVPVSFIPCAIGSSGVTSWQKGGGTTNYDYMVARLTEAGSGCRGMLYFQGEGDAANSMSTSTYQGHAETMVDDWWADTGTPVVLFRIGEGGISPASKTDAIREAQRIVGSTHPHAILGPDPYGLEPTNIHFVTTPAIQGVGTRTWEVIGPAFVDQMPNQARVRFPQIRVLQAR